MVFGRIYSIRSHQTDDIYIGSTKQPLSKRMVEHRSKYKNQKSYTTSFEILKFDDAYIELIEENEFESRDLLLKREGELIRLMNCVNKIISGRSQKEYQDETKDQKKEYYKNYRLVNIDKLKDQCKLYNENNKEKLNEQKKIYYQENKDRINEQKRLKYQKNKEKNIK